MYFQHQAANSTVFEPRAHESHAAYCPQINSPDRPTARACSGPILLFDRDFTTHSLTDGI